MFDGHALDFMRDWGTLGGVDEQNIEGVHPRFNQLARKFGNCRGALRQKKVFEEFLFMNSPFIVECIEEMMEKTKRKKVRTKNDESEGQGEALTDLERIGNALLASSGNGMDTLGGEGSVEKLLMDGEEEEADNDGMEGGGGKRRRRRRVRFIWRRRRS